MSTFILPVHSAEALEKKAPISGRSDELKFWQATLLINGYAVSYIPLNEERVEFFLKHYDEDSGQYRIVFKDKYERWLKQKQKSSENEYNASK